MKFHKNIPLFLFSTFLVVHYSSARLVSVEPADASGDDNLMLIFDASEGTGGLIGAVSVYMHSGVVTTGPDGTAWENAVGNWGMDDGIGKMTKVEGETDKWQITLTPRTYYSVDAARDIFRLSVVFRNADGSREGKGMPGTYDWGYVADNGDIYIDLPVSEYVLIDSPQAGFLFLNSGEAVTVTAHASAEATAMSLFINDEVQPAIVSSGTNISYDFVPAATGAYTLRIEATIHGVEVEASRTLSIGIIPETPEAALPTGMKKGINYHVADKTKATLVLEAPEKNFVFVVGDFTNWGLSADYVMNKTPDKKLFWLEIDDLTPGQPYVFQYWVDGEIKIGDPYAEQVADPWNDRYLPAGIYPELPSYTNTDNGIATFLQTDQAEYPWSVSEDTWTSPAKEDLVIYELLVRDFLGSHSYADLADTLSYLKRLGVNAIELMPVTEFEGNNSWGYNPSYFFAPDKYYGARDDLKKFIETAHQKGIAVIQDMVLNHAFGQNAMVQLYWDAAKNTVNEDNPWFNPVAKHPFNVGFDFDHESPYTKNFVDSVNRYWLEEYHFDGFRFDLSKGFTQMDYGDDVGAWSSYDQSRIDLLTRMANKIWQHDPAAYVILEHFAEASEEAVLAGKGMLLWRVMNYAYGNALKGKASDISGAKALTHISFMESHDEQRLGYEMLTDGSASGSYAIKNKPIAFERAKMGAAFHFLQAGPKMIWQFGELGYDIDINYMGRVGEKPLPWGEGNMGYYEDELRQYIYQAYSAILLLRNQYRTVVQKGTYVSNLNGNLKQFSIAHAMLNICVIGNFGVESGSVDPGFPGRGTWYDYFSGEALEVTNPHLTIDLLPGEFHIYTSDQVSDGFPGVVEVFQNPVSVDPAGFKIGDEITITFDAALASTDGTDGLVGAEKVYMHAGLVTSDPENTDLTNIVGNLTDDGVGEMSEIEADKWQITLIPTDYFGLAEDETAFRIGMYFRDASNINIGKGFRDQLIYLDIVQEGDLIKVEPADFSVTDEITLTFNAALGNRALLDAEKVYLHSGVVLDDVPKPMSSNWSNVVGIWGADNGVGEMTKKDDSDEWTITFTPQDYYGIDGDAYWLAMVFRDAGGNKKGTGIPGDFEGGFIDQNGDIYIEIPVRMIVASVDVKKQVKFLVCPNPASDSIIIQDGITGYYIYDSSGRLVLSGRSASDGQVDVSSLPNGLYLIKTDPNSAKTTKLIINK